MSCSKSRVGSHGARSVAVGAVAPERVPASPVPPSTLASDAERERIVANLRAAHGEGRLDYDELQERTAAAYQARTHGDLAPLTADLPQEPVIRPAPSAPDQGVRSALRASWIAWAAVVTINVLIWLLVSLGVGEAIYFWPIWVAGPWGAVLVFGSIATLVANEHQRR